MLFLGKNQPSARGFRQTIPGHIGKSLPEKPTQIPSDRRTLF